MRLRVLCTLLVLLSLVPYSLSQVATGVLPFNSYGGGPFDTVNLGNLDVHFSVPVLHKAGRGIPFAYDLNYDSSIYRAVVSNGTSSWQPVTTIGNIASYWGWQGLGPVFSPYVGYQVTYSTGACGINNSYQEWQFSNFVYYDTAGTAHPVPAGGTYYNSGSCNGQGPPNGPHPPGVNTGKATDGSGYVINFSLNAGSASGNIQSKDGTTISAGWFTTPPTGSSPYTATDRNGNKISFSNGTYIDALGQSVLLATGAAPNPVSFSYIPPANEQTGTRVSVTANFVNYTVKTNFGALDSGGHAIAEYSSATAVALVDNITLPDGTKYKFSYEPTTGSCTLVNGTSACVTGRILSVTLPTGGTITYAYSGGANGIINDGSTAGLTRQLSSPGGTWSYSRSQVSGNYWTTTETSPTGDNTVHSFTEDSATTTPSTYSFYETQRQIYQGSISSNGCSATVTTNCLLLTNSTCWNGTASNCTSTAITSPINETSVTTQYPNSGQQSKTDTFYNGGSTGSGLVSEIDQYAYSTGTPTTLLRKTTILYGSFSLGGPCGAIGNNVASAPCAVSVLDGSGNVLSETRYTYDEYSPLQSTTGTPQWVSISGSRGNPTTISTALSLPNGQYGALGSSLTTHFHYYDTGNVYQSQDVNGQSTTYTYSTVAQGNSTKSCGNSFPTSVTLPISGLSSSASTTYDCVGGVVTAATDLNGNTTTTTYSDPYFWRAANVVAPYTSNTTTTTTTFAYTAYNSTNGNLAKVDSKMLFNGNNSVAEQLTTFGIYGQTLYSQQPEGPSSANYDSTQALYDSLLRANKSSMPCVSTTITFTDQNQACPSAAVTTSTFDALGRVTQTTDGNPTPGWIKYTYTQNDVLQQVGPAPSGENTKQKQLEYDSLGRLTKVCELTNLTGSNVCTGMQGSPNGYLTTYAYGTTATNTTLTVTQNAQASSGQQTRVYTYDMAGRLVSELNPENGTTTYTYDSDSSGVCSGTYTGDLVKLVDAKGNKICYQYDAIHRNTGITYPSSDPDYSVTPSKTFVYDSATFNSTAMSNPKGRLVEAYTGASGSKTTDEFFSYSVRGELTDTYQCTPHSGTNGCASVSNYYHVTAGFFENGALKTLSSSISGLPNQTYGLDGMGRTNAVTASAGQLHLVNGATTSYGLYQSTVTYGSGDSDVVQLDQYTGRMTSYQFTMGTISGQNKDTGTLNWNSNGSLASLAIVNQIPSTADTQTCSYTHDDLSRISSVGCLNGATNKWNQAFAYDAFGNITKTTTGPGISFMPNYDTSKNWITSLPGPITTTTDNNGQMTYDGVHSYSWDAEGKMHSVDAIPASCSTSGECLTYDALGRMVEKTVGSTYTQIVYGPQGRFATMNGQTTLVSAFIPLPGSQAVYTGASLLTTNKVAYYRHTDHLGSSRLATTPTQTLYSSTAYGPYGEPYSQAGATDLSFTGEEQDTVSGIHDFPARKYPPVQGRWLSPDPAGMAAANPANPQSWNRYAYVLNNPLSLVDPLGLDGGCPGGISGGCFASWAGSPGISGNDPMFGQPDLAAITGSAGTGMMGLGAGLGSGGGVGSWNGLDQILPGENSPSYSLGPSPLQILQNVLSGNFSDLGIPTLGQLMNNAWVLDAVPGAPSGGCMSAAANDAIKAKQGFDKDNATWVLEGVAEGAVQGAIVGGIAAPETAGTSAAAGPVVGAVTGAAKGGATSWIWSYMRGRWVQSTTFLRSWLDCSETASMPVSLTGASGTHF